MDIDLPDDKSSLADYQATMELQNNILQQIKEELDNNISEEQEMMGIKSENETFRPETLSRDVPDNPFENVQLEIKQEINFSLVLERETTESQKEQIEANDRTQNEMLDASENVTNMHAEVKKEGVPLVLYDYPSFDDVGSNSNENETTDARSVDSYEATALGNVEACLRDEINIKCENDGNYAESDKVEFNHTDVKMESDLTLTDTHVTCNSVSSADIKPPTLAFDGLPKDAVVKLPGNTQIHNDEEILPSYNMDNNTDMNDFHLNSISSEDFEETDNVDNRESFQLNSITGNVLSLEQEAYGLLKAKKRMEDKRERPFICTECPKAYTSKKGLSNHWSVHRTIERRAMGVIKGLKTRKENQKKSVIEDLNKKNINDKVRNKKNRNKRDTNKKDTNQEDTNQKDTNNINMKSEKYEIVSDDQKLSHRAIRMCTMGVIKGMKIRKENLKKNKEGNGTEDKKSERYEIVQEDQKVSQNKKEGYECTCGKIFRRRSRMETCLRSHNLFESDSNSELVSCVTCSKSFRSKDELASHRKRLHRKRFPCKFCPTDYETRKELFKHLQMHQKVQLIEYKVISEVMKTKQKLRCFMCSKTWSELSELKSHVMNDHREPYICPHCKNTFTKIIDFGNHTKTYHPEVEGQSVLDVLEAFSRLIKAWKCEECELQFLEADKLAMHQIEKHSPEMKAEQQYQCTDCRRVFISQKSLTSHRRIHHSTEGTEESKEVIQGIMCLECRKICKDMTALTSHMRLHSPERKFPCKFCDFRFATQEKRKSHAEIHTGDMKYVCFICEYQCSSENRLKQHKTSLKHANMKEYLLTGKPLLEEPESTSKQEKVKELKKKEGSAKKRKRDKKEHSEEKRDRESCSSGSEEVTCDICGDKFSSERIMLEHKQTHPFIEFPNDDKPSRIFFK